MKATIDNVSPASSIRSYIPGSANGDSMDNLYNIGHQNTDKWLLIINANSGTTVNFTVNCEASLDGNPVKIKGLVIADAESLSSSEELKVSADGDWKVIEVKKNIGAGSYEIEKNNIAGTVQEVHLFNGNDNNTAAITVLSFNESAYDTEANNYEISFNVEVKGAGLTAIALGLLMPNSIVVMPQKVMISFTYYR